MSGKDVKRVVQYFYSIPEMARILREEQREVEDVYDTLKAAGGEAGHGGRRPGAACGTGRVSCGGSGGMGAGRGDRREAGGFGGGRSGGTDLSGRALRQVQTGAGDAASVWVQLGQDLCEAWRAGQHGPELVSQGRFVSGGGPGGRAYG